MRGDDSNVGASSMLGLPGVPLRQRIGPMSATYQHAHGLGAAEARRRLLEKASEHGVDVTFDPGSEEAGEVRAASPLGVVIARFRIGEAAIDVDVLKKPMMVSAAMVRAALKQGLDRVLG